MYKCSVLFWLCSFIVLTDSCKSDIIPITLFYNGFKLTVNFSFVKLDKMITKKGHNLKNSLPFHIANIKYF